MVPAEECGAWSRRENVAPGPGRGRGCWSRGENAVPGPEEMWLVASGEDVPPGPEGRMWLLVPGEGVAARMPSKSSLERDGRSLRGLRVFK